MFQAPVKRMTDCVACEAQFLDFGGSGSEIDICKVIDVEKTEHVVKHVKDQNGVITSGKPSKRSFFGNSFERDAEIA